MSEALLLTLTVPKRCLTVAERAIGTLTVLLVCIANIAIATVTVAGESVASDGCGRFTFRCHERAACLGDCHNGGQGESFLHYF